MEPLYSKPDVGFDMTFIGTFEEVDLYQDDIDSTWYFIKSSAGASWVDVPRRYFAEDLERIQKTLRPALTFATAHYNLSH